MNKQEKAAYDKARYPLLREARLVYLKAWRDKPENREKNRLASAAWHKAHPERVNASKRAWELRNPEALAGRRARQKNRLRAKLTGYVNFLLERQQAMCPHCAGDLVKLRFHIDHIKPLACGGTHEAHNLQLLCPSCNCRKQDRTDLD